MSNPSKTHVGRRKSAVALVNFVKGNGDFVINKKKGFTYLQQDPFAIQTVIAPLKLINLEKKYDIICSVRGGGISAQAEAIQLGVARALCSLDAFAQTLPLPLPLPPAQAQAQAQAKTTQTKSGKENDPQQLITEQHNNDSAVSSEKTTTETRPLLKEGGYLRRDSRIKERRKYGLKKARKAEQYSKR